MVFFISVNVLISPLAGWFLGRLVVILCRRPPSQLNRFAIVMTPWGNTGVLPACGCGISMPHQGEPLWTPVSIEGNGLCTLLPMSRVYTLDYNMMEPLMEFYEVVEEGNEIVEKEMGGEEHRPTDISRPLLVEAEWANGQADRNCRRANSNSAYTPASLLATIVGIVPQVESFLFVYDAPLLSTVWRSWPAQWRLPRCSFSGGWSQRDPASQPSDFEILSAPF